MTKDEERTYASLGRISAEPLLAKAPASTKAVAVMVYALVDEIKEMQERITQLEEKK